MSGSWTSIGGIIRIDGLVEATEENINKAIDKILEDRPKGYDGDLNYFINRTRIPSISFANVTFVGDLEDYDHIGYEENMGFDEWLLQITEIINGIGWWIGFGNFQLVDDYEKNPILYYYSGKDWIKVFDKGKGKGIESAILEKKHG